MTLAELHTASRSLASRLRISIGALLRKHGIDERLFDNSPGELAGITIGAALAFWRLKRCSAPHAGHLVVGRFIIFTTREGLR
jgi:hypothetical protein